MLSLPQSIATISSPSTASPIARRLRSKVPHLPQAKFTSQSPMPNPTLLWFWVALGCCISSRSKEIPPNNRPFNWDAEGGYIPFRFQGAYRGRWRREDHQARFEESRARERGRGEKKGFEGVEGVEGEKERRKRKKRTKKYVHVHKMSMTEAHEIMERAIGLQAGGKTKSETAVDKLFKGFPGQNVESRSVIGSSKKTCAGTATATFKSGHKVGTEGTLDELERNGKLKSRSVLGLSGLTLVE
ncbi:hypothetical protein N7G274_002122 [Stereocaulon virgatum]|uniref:Uncharacterized protein n=1 Tax=Stereocaulon virgatum TaxID=373712 RepID=A0ABR4ALW8_9LECA